MTWTGHHFSRPELNQATKSRLIAGAWLDKFPEAAAKLDSSLEKKIKENAERVRQIRGQAAAFVEMQGYSLTYQKELINALNKGNIFLISPDFGSVKHPLVYREQLVEQEEHSWAEDSFTDRSSQLECVTAWETKSLNHRNADLEKAKRNYYFLPLPWFQIVYRTPEGKLRNLLADDLDGVNIIEKTNYSLALGLRKPLIGHERDLEMDFRLSYFIVKKAYLDAGEATKDVKLFKNYQKKNSSGSWEKDWENFKKETQALASYLTDLVALHLSLLFEKTAHEKIVVVTSKTDPTLKVAEAIGKYSQKEMVYLDINRNAEYPTDGLHNKSAGNIVSGYQTGLMEKAPGEGQIIVQNRSRIRGCQKPR